MSTIDVVAGIIQREDGKILLARRKPGSHLAGYWEFPGGKIEDGESPEECLERELREELGIITKTGAFVAESVYDYGKKTVRLMAYFVQYRGDEFVLDSHDRVEWVHLSEVDDYQLAPADMPLLQYILSDCSLIQTEE